MKAIKSIGELKQLASHTDGVDCFIGLNGGLRSSKTIWYNTDSNTFDVLNEIDDTIQEDLTEEQLVTETNIMEAIQKNALIQY